jgi:HEPN domain-containing protein
LNEPHELRERAMRWLRWAQEDLDLAQSHLRDRMVVPRGACTWAQQAAEKSLKALLVDGDQDPPKVHNLVRLARMVPDIAGSLDTEQLAELTQWALDGRYPGDLHDATYADAERATAFAAQVVQLAAQRLTTGDGSA